MVVTGKARVNAAKIRPGQDVVVIGAGGVGLNTIQGAHIAGARRIVAVDMNVEKLAAAKEFGAMMAFWPAMANLKQAKDIIGRGADAVFAWLARFLPMTRPRAIWPKGKHVAVGMPKSDKAIYEPVMMSAVGQGMIGTKMGDVVIKRDIPWMVDLYQQGRLNWMN